MGVPAGVIVDVKVGESQTEAEFTLGPALKGCQQRDEQSGFHLSKLLFPDRGASQHRNTGEL